MKIGSGETTNPILQLLRHPTVYNFVQRVAGTDRVRRQFVDQYVRPKRGARILDLGCGTGDLLACLSEASYVGIDLNEDYISAARKRYAEQGTFLVGDATKFSEQIKGPFEFIIAVGLLHHLDDQGVSALTSAALGALASGGKFISVDGCFDSNQGMIRRWMVSRDRGRALRTPEGYSKLFPSDFVIKHFVQHDWGNIPWTFCIIVATAEGVRTAH